MDLFANPVTLGGLVAFIALGAWAMGRLQGAAEQLGPARDPRVPQRPDRNDAPGQSLPGGHALAAALQPDASSQLLPSLALADSLGDLHAEISAFRRQERVLTSLEAELMPLHFATGDCVAKADPAGFAPLAPPVRTEGALSPRQVLRS